MDLHPRKRKTSEKACFLCQKDMVECDERTPCSRCIIKGVPHMCFSSTRTSPSYPFNNNSIRPNISPSSTSPKSTSANSSTSTSTSTTTTTSSSQSQKNVNSSNSGSGGSQQQQQQSNSDNSNQQQQQQQQQPTDIVKQDYNGIANLLINELRELKDGQKKIYDELIYLKSKNEKLELVNESLLSKLSSLTTNDTNSTNSTSQAHQLLHSNTLQQDNALTYPIHHEPVSDYHFRNIFIVIDLLKFPPIVLNCSKSFSQLIGYSQDEIIGLPWTEITHPNLMEKTMSFFQQHHRNLSDKKNIMEIAQVYKCRDGSIFSTIDTHTLIYDSENTKPICDLVNIRLLEGTEPIGLPSDIIKSTSTTNSNRLRLKNEISSVDESPPSTPVNYINNNNSTTTTTTTSTTPNTPTKNYNNSPFIYNHNNSNNNNNNSKIYEQPSTPTTPITPITPNQLNSTTGNIANTPITTTSNDFNSKINLNDIPSVLYNVNSNEMDLNNDTNNQFLIPNSFTYDPSILYTDIPPTVDNSNSNSNNNNSINNNNTIIHPSSLNIPSTTITTPINSNLIDSNNGLLTDFLDPMIDSNPSSNSHSNSIWNFDGTDWNNVSTNQPNNSKQ